MTPSPSMFEKAKGAVKDTALSIVGKKHEAAFKDKIQEIIVKESVSEEEARKMALEDGFSACLIASSRQESVIDPAGDEMKNLDAGLKLLISAETRKKMKETPLMNPDFRPLTVPPPTAEQMNGAATYFENKFDGRMPPPGALEVYSGVQIQMQLLFGRLKADMESLIPDIFDPATSATMSGNLDLALKDFPEIAADISMLEECKKFAQRIEKQFSRKVAWDETKSASIAELRKIFSKANKERVQSVLRNASIALGAGAIAFVGGAAGMGMTALVPLTKGLSGKLAFPLLKTAKENVLSSSPRYSDDDIKAEENEMLLQKIPKEERTAKLREMRKEKMLKGALGRTLTAAGSFGMLLLSVGGRSAKLGAYNVPKTIVEGARYKAGSLINKDLPQI